MSGQHLGSGHAPRRTIGATAPLLACLLLAAIAGSADATTVIGTVTRLQGAANGTTSGASVSLAAGADVFAGETISTDPAARLELTLSDRTVVTLGEKATLTLDDFVFRPTGQSKLHVAIDGAFRFVSGKLAAGATREASVTTSFATIGVRGTDFWSGPIDGRFGVVVLEGRVMVSHRGRTVVLRLPRSGVDLNSANAAPGAVTPWTAAKIGRAIATVTFR